jgi:hypothetical protein
MNFVAARLGDGGMTQPAPPAGFTTFTATSCGPPSLAVESFAVAFVSFLPASTLLVSLPPPSGSQAAVAIVCLIALPRLLCYRPWACGPALEGRSLSFTLGLALYCNLVMVTFFFSPLLIGLCIWHAPQLALPLLVAYTVQSRSRRPDLDGHGAGWRDFSRCGWGYHAFRRYSSFRLDVADSLRARAPTRPCMLAMHPHGCVSDYRIQMDGLLYDALPGRSVLMLAASVVFSLPLVRELSLWTRTIDASRAVATRALENKHSLMVIPGGEAEQIRTRRGVEEVYLSPRFGFVKLALSTNAALVPCYAFGTTDLYSVVDALYAPREALRKYFGVCIPLFYGAAGFLPRRVPISVVLGAPIDLPPCAIPGAPTVEEVQSAHASYVKALRRLFEEHKGRFGYSDRELIVS